MKRLAFAGISLFSMHLFICAGCQTGDKVDTSFDTRVARPAYSQDRPVILFDDAHHNWHRPSGSYRPFVRLVESDGYRVRTNKAAVTADVLAGADILVVAAAVGNNERNDDDAFAPAECDAIRDWVRSGGALLLIVDHYPTGDAVEELASRFGVALSKGVAEDPVHHDPERDSSHIVFSRDNGGLTTHPINDGRDSSERIERVLTFTGEAVRADAPAAGFLALSDSAVARPAIPRVEHKGKDVIVNVEYGPGVPAAGWSQGVAVEFGKGRVVVLGEAAMLSARLNRFDKSPMGMNTPGYDNRQLALNIVHWLSRLI